MHNTLVQDLTVVTFDDEPTGSIGTAVVARTDDKGYLVVLLAEPEIAVPVGDTDQSLVQLHLQTTLVLVTTYAERVYAFPPGMTGLIGHLLRRDIRNGNTLQDGFRSAGHEIGVHLLHHLNLLAGRQALERVLNYGLAFRPELHLGEGDTDLRIYHLEHQRLHTRHIQHHPPRGVVPEVGFVVDTLAVRINGDQRILLLAQIARAHPKRQFGVFLTQGIRCLRRVVRQIELDTGVGPIDLSPLESLVASGIDDIGTVGFGIGDPDLILLVIIQRVGEVDDRMRRQRASQEGEDKINLFHNNNNNL